MLNSLLISIYRLYIKRAKDFDKHLGTFFRIFKDLEEYKKKKEKKKNRHVYANDTALLRRARRSIYPRNIKRENSVKKKKNETRNFSSSFSLIFD